jgi:hypothetical protein
MPTAANASATTLNVHEECRTEPRSPDDAHHRCLFAGGVAKPDSPAYRVGTGPDASRRCFAVDNHERGAVAVGGREHVTLRQWDT